MPILRPKRRIKPLRVMILILGIVFVVYVFICAVKFTSDAINAVLEQKKYNIEREIPVMSEYDDPERQYNLAVLAADERVTSDQSLMMINKTNLLPANFEPDVSEYNNSGLWMNSCMQSSFENLSEDVKDKFSEKLFVSSAFRTEAEQRKEIEEQGDIAQALGASEHQAGLGVDVYILYHAGEGFIDCDAGKWVNEHCWQCGFIIRYPKDAEDKTGISYEPWHLRYVGAPHAEYIMQNGLTLEEYFDLLEIGTLYKISTADGNYAVTRFSGDTLYAPENFKEAVISIDNTGGHIATFLL